MGDRGFNPIPLGEILSPRPAATRKMFQWRGRPGERKPLWAILGEKPPLSWDPPAGQDIRLLEYAAAAESGDDQPAQVSAPPSDVRNQRPPGIWVVERPSLGVGPAHTAIEFVPEKGQPEWISAGPNRLIGGRLASGVGTLDEEGKPIGERSADDPNKTTTVGQITPGEGMTDADQWEVLKALDAYYKDNVDYDVNPEWQDSYNSNSYVRGLLDTGGAAYTVPFDDYVGGESPLSVRHFVPPHLWGTGFEDSLKPNQPPPRFRRLPGKK
jgi:hypothetical protein